MPFIGAVPLNDPQWRKEMPEWAHVVGDRNLTEMICADFGLGDCCLALMTFNVGPADDPSEIQHFEVGLGESMRPYAQLYTGADAEKAGEIWSHHLAELMGYVKDPDDDGFGDEFEEDPNDPPPPDGWSGVIDQSRAKIEEYKKLSQPPEAGS